MHLMELYLMDRLDVKPNDMLFVDGAADFVPSIIESFEA
jgi:hypothetical protein